MNYYIKGDATNADKIKTAFERLGYDVKEWCFTSGIYYTLNGKIVNTNFCSNEYKLVLNNPDYKELELPVEPKFKIGDWVVIGNCHNSTYQVECVLECGYMLKHTRGVLMPFPFSSETRLSLWSIADAKNGDVLCYKNEISIYKHDIKNCTKRKPTFGGFVYHCCYYGKRFITDSLYSLTEQDKMDVHPATKEQRDLLFAKMNEVGYEWDAVNKELNKIQPHYDIANFHAGMPVLVRADNNCKWDYSLFSRITGNEDWQFAVCNGVSFTQCIPFEWNEHLLGTTNPCDERFINW